jgi:fructokinase
MLVGIDWGGTKIEGVAMEPDGTELARLRESTPRHDYFGCIAVIKKMIESMESQVGRRGSVGIGIPGSLEPKSRLAKGASSTWLLGRPVEKDLVEALQREIRVENDADCFAASEALDGAGVGRNVVFAVILGSGAGAGIAVNGAAHHGPNNSGGEWGHNPLPRPDVTEIPGAPCYCGRHGCMETWVSGRAFEAEYERHTGTKLLARQIMELKRKGDHLSNVLWRRYVERRRALSGPAGRPCQAHLLDRLPHADQTGGSRRLERSPRRRLAVEIVRPFAKQENRRWTNPRFRHVTLSPLN